MNDRSNLTAEFAKLGPWIFQFRIDGQDYGGGISVGGDARIDQFFGFAPETRTILELGSLEGAHTFILAGRPGVERVLAWRVARQTCAKRDSSRNCCRCETPNFRRPTSSTAN